MIAIADRELVVGLTLLPFDLPKGATWVRRDCGCYLVLQSGHVHEFVCEHGFFVGRECVDRG